MYQSSVLRDSWRAINRVFRGFGKPAPTLPQTWPPATPPCSGGISRGEQRDIRGIITGTRGNHREVSSKMYLRMNWNHSPFFK